MDEVIEMIGNVAEPVVDTLQDLGGDAIDYVKDHAPQYIRYVAYALRHIHL